MNALVYPTADDAIREREAFKSRQKAAGYKRYKFTYWISDEEWYKSTVPELSKVNYFLHHHYNLIADVLDYHNIKWEHEYAWPGDGNFYLWVKANTEQVDVMFNRVEKVQKSIQISLI